MGSIIIARRIAIVVNLLTEETQTAYKQGRPTSDTLDIITKILKEKTRDASITLMGLAKAFDRTNRQLLYTVLTQKGVPIPLIKLIRKTQTNTYLNIRDSNILGAETEVNVGIMQGSPLSALLFVVYTDHMVKTYRKERRAKREEKRAEQAAPQENTPTQEQPNQHQQQNNSLQPPRLARRIRVRQKRKEKKERE